MSTTIDNKVVSMAFDNSKFESKVAQSISTLDKLKQSLNMEDTEKSFNKLQNTANNMNFNGLSDGVESVRLKFSALEVFALTALTNISNKVLRVGENIVSALTIDPIKTGFQEYETQIDAIQTIYANTKSKGTSLDDINEALAELNTYADKTIYNFTQMTSNIGRFTAAGVELKPATKAIQGIANLAAVSGSTSQQASTAMYQLSQALSSGVVKLMDWNSVVNANMGGETFQNALKETARQFGVNVDAIIKKQGSFRESLQDGWLTADILNTTLQKLTINGANDYLAEYNSLSAEAISQMRDEAVASGNVESAFREMAKELSKTSKLTEDQIYDILDLSQTAEEAATKVKTVTQLWDTLKEAAQSGWTQTWQLIIGDFEEARTFLTQVSDYFGAIIQKSSDARNSFLKGALSAKEDIVTLSDWSTFIFNKQNTDGVKRALKDVAKEYGVDVDKMIEANGGFAESLNEKWLTADILRKTMEKYADAEWSVAQETMRADGYTEQEIEDILHLRWALANTNSSLSEFVDLYTRPTGRTLLLDSFWNIIKNVADVVKTLKEAWQDVFPSATSDQLYQLLVKFKEFTERLKLSEERLGKLRTTFSGVFSLISLAKDAIVSLGKGLKPIINSVSPLLDTVLNLGEAFGNWAIGIRETANELGIFDKISSKLATFVEQISFNINAIIKRFPHLVDECGGGFLGVLQAIGYSLVNSLDVISDIFNEVWGIDLYDKIGSVQNVLRDLVSFMGSVLNGTLEVSVFLIEKLGQAFDWCGQKVSGFEINFKTPTFKNIVDIFVAIGSAVKSVGLAIINFAVDGIERLSAAFGNGDLGNTILQVIKVLFTGHIAAELTSLNKKVGDFGDILDKVADSLEMFQMKIKSEAFMTYAKAMLVFAGAMFVLASIDSDRLEDATYSIIALIGAMTAAVAILDKFVGRSTKAMKSLKSVNSSFGKLKVGLSNIGTFLSNTFSSFNELLHAQSVNVLAGSLIKFAAAIAVLAAAMWIISKIDPDRISQCLTAITLLVGEMILVMKKLDGVKGFKAGGLIGMGIALTLIAASAKILSTIEPEKLEPIMLGLLSFLVTMSVCAKFLDSKYNAITKFGNQMIGVGIALVIVAGACKILGSMKDDEYNKAIGGFYALIIGLTACAKVLDESKHGFEQFGVELIGMAIAIGILAGIGKIIATMSWEEMGKAGAGLLACVVMLTAAAKVLDSDSAAITNFSKEMKGMAVAIAILALSAKLLSTIGPVEMAMSMTAIAGGMWILVSAIKKCEGLQNGAQQLLIASGAIMVFALALKVLSTIGLTDMLTGLFGIVAVLAVFGVAALLLKPLVPILKELSVSLLIFGGALAVIGIGLTLISTGITALGIALTTSIGAIMGSLILIVKGVGELVVAICQAIIESLPAVKDVFKALIITGLQAILETVNESVSLLAELVPPILEAIIALTPVLVDGLVDFIIKVLDSLKTRIPELIVSIMDFLGVLFKSIVDACNAADPDGLLKIIEGFALVSAVIAAAVVIGPMIPKAMIALVGIGAVIAEMALLIAAIGNLNQIPGLQDMVGSGGNLLQEVGTAIGKFVGGIVGGIAEGVTDSLPVIATNLSAFMLNLTPFIEGATAINSSTVSGVTSLVGAILAITAAEIIEGIASWFTGRSTIEGFVDDVRVLGEGVAAFAEETKNINGASVKNAANAGKMIAEMASSLPNTGGLLGKLVGENDMSLLAPQLKTFGKAIADFSAEVAGNVDEDAVRSATNAGKMLSDMAEELPNSGGFVGWFMGENDMNLFGIQLKEFGAAIAAFSRTMVANPINEDAISSAANAGKLLSNMANTLPNTGGLVTWFTGDNDIAKFGKHLVKFGEKLVEFSSTISGKIDEEAMTSAANISKMLAEMAATLPNTGGLISWFAGDSDLETFGKGIVKLGKHLVEFNNKVAGSDFTASTNAIVALRGLIDLFMGARDYDPKGIEIFIDSFQGIANLSVKKFCTEFNNGFTKAKAALLSFLNGAISVLKGKYGEFKSIGSYLVSGFIVGMSDTDAMNRVKKAASNMATEAYKAAMKALDAHSPSKLFMEVGSYIPQGMAIGIDKMSDLVGDSAEEMANTAINSTTSIISKLANAVNSDIDTNPTIRPVLDLTEVQNGANSINAMMTKASASTASVGFVGSEAQRQSAALSQLSATVSGYGANNSSNIEQNNTFNISGNNPKEIANEVSKILQRQVERRDAQWA